MTLLKTFRARLAPPHAAVVRTTYSIVEAVSWAYHAKDETSWEFRFDGRISYHVVAPTTTWLRLRFRLAGFRPHGVATRWWTRQVTCPTVALL